MVVVSYIVNGVICKFMLKKCYLIVQLVHIMINALENVIYVQQIVLIVLLKGVGHVLSIQLLLLFLIFLFKIPLLLSILQLSISLQIQL